jgi:hypothetical protein
MLADFLKKFLLHSSKDQAIISHIRAGVGRKREYKRDEGFLAVKSPYVRSAQAFVYEPSIDMRLKKIHMTGPYFRVWFTVEKNGDVYFVNFEKLG